jgi:site-specific DNA recombinase
MTAITSTDQVRGAAYQRVSTKDQEASRQNEGNRAAAARNGWQLTEYEEALSASRFAGRGGGASRGEYRRLLADITAGQADVLILWEASRGDRRLTGWSALLDACREHGVLIHVTSEDYTYDVSRARDWKALAEAGIDSALESEKLSMRITDGKRSRAAKGVPQGSIAYGLRRVWDPRRPRLNWERDEPDPQAAPVVARIIREAGRGDGYGAICGRLNAEGIPPPSAARGRGRQAARWNRTTITRIAGNPAYARFGVVTEEESLQARRRVTDAMRKGERPGRQSYRYSQLMTCPCGGLVRGVTIRGEPQYRCPAGHGGHGNGITAAAADDFLDAVAVEFITTRAAELVTRTDGAGAARHRTEAAGHRQKIREAVESYNADRIGISDLEDIRKFRLAKAEAAEKRARQAELPAELSGLPDGDSAVVAARWQALSTSARKAAIRIIMPGLTLVPGRRDVPADQRVIPWPPR